MKERAQTAYCLFAPRVRCALFVVCRCGPQSASAHRPVRVAPSTPKRQTAQQGTTAISSRHMHCTVHPLLVRTVCMAMLCVVPAGVFVWAAVRFFGPFRSSPAAQQPAQQTTEQRRAHARTAECSARSRAKGRACAPQPQRPWGVPSPPQLPPWLPRHRPPPSPLQQHARCAPAAPHSPRPHRHRRTDLYAPPAHARRRAPCTVPRRWSFCALRPSLRRQPQGPRPLERA
jgi:hypothetical protein